MAENIVHVLLADDHKVLRDGLRVLLEDEGDLKVVGEASTGEEAIRLTIELIPDVIVMDLGMPGGSGLDAIQKTREKEIPVHIIDPRVGKSPSELSSATVISATATEADALSTALMVLGVRAGLELIRNLPGTEAILIDKQLRLYPSDGFPANL